MDEEMEGKGIRRRKNGEIKRIMMKVDLRGRAIPSHRNFSSVMPFGHYEFIFFASPVCLIFAKNRDHKEGKKKQWIREKREEKWNFKI
jgi:hypothetical protein